MEQREEKGQSRRGFLSLAVMISSMAAAYGFFTGIVMKFLYPVSRKKKLRPMFVAFADKVPPGKSHTFFAPNGEQVILTNTGGTIKGENHSYLAFSSRCPHLGCKVHYDSGENHFVCPCHQGVFNNDGVAVSGPPAQASQSLSGYKVNAEGNSIYVMVEVS